MDIGNRSAWNARDPVNTPTTVNASQRTEFIVHHSAGPFDQSLRAIQDHHMDSDQLTPGGANDIGYNFAVNRNPRAYHLRGLNVQGAHAAPNNVSGIGVLVVGDWSNQLPPAGVLEVLDELYHWVCGQLGKTLTVRTHRDVNPTACPGDALHSWVHANLGSGESPPVNDDPPPSGGGWLGGLIMSLPTLRQGDDGPAVRRVQALCVAHGGSPANEINNSGGVDGDFGPGTNRAVRAAQSAGAPPVDGIVGEITWRYLIGG